MVSGQSCDWPSPLYNDVIMGMIASQITSLTIVYSTVYSGADQRKHQSSLPLAFVWGIHRSLVYSPHKWPVTRKMFPFDDITMEWRSFSKVVAMFNHVGRSFNVFKCQHQELISCFRIWAYMLQAYSMCHHDKVANIIESSLLLPEWFLIIAGENTTRKLFLSLALLFKRCCSSLRSFSFCVIPLLLLTFLWLGCYCSKWLYLSPRN